MSRPLAIFLLIIVFFFGVLAVYELNGKAVENIKNPPGQNGMSAGKVINSDFRG